MSPRQLVFVGLLGVVAFAVIPTGCGNRASVDNSFTASCRPGSATCLSEEVGQICNAQGQWATFQCGDGRRCEAKACVPTDSACEPGSSECISDSVGQLCSEDLSWLAFACGLGQTCLDGTCVGTCTPQLRECASESLQRICRSDGLGWETSECPAGTTCDNAECIGSCNAGTTSCITSRLLRECRLDETGYGERECPTSMSCSTGKCVPNATATCIFGQDVCMGETTALECLRDGSGYLVKDCPSGTRCRTGKCLGTVCAAGSTSCVNTNTADFIGVQTCNDDGSGYSVAICDSAGKCVLNQDNGKYECYVPPCTTGDEVCGDPTAAEESTDRLSRCETLTDGKLGWVIYKCDLPASCKSTSPTAAACHTECSPADKRCSADGTAVETCNDSGTWESTGCDDISDGQSMCVLNPITKAVACGDKDCRTLQTSITNYTTRGRCSSDLIRKCDEDARLGIAVACEEGQCVTEIDSFGTCKDPTRCQHEDGWRECIASNDAYRTCLSGHWEFTLCAEAELCTNVGTGLATCGNDCIPNKIRCIDGDYQTCTSGETWGESQHCSVGECNPTTNRCETACVPGQLRCSGEVIVASDGTSLGSREVQTCTSNGAWNTAKGCSETTLCRRSGMGPHLGCVECVGGQVPGGNEEGAVDSRCGKDEKGYAICQSDNTWPATDSSCDGTEHCVKQRDGSITGTCSNYGCSTGRPQRCVGYEIVTLPVTVSDCCTGDCDSASGQCLHRKSHYDPICTDTTSCFTGRFGASGAAISETCCAGFCRSGQGCLKIKANACATVTDCATVKVDHNNICCGTCSSTGLCATAGEAPHPYGEYFACGISSNICWGVGSCAWQSSGSTSGAMFANCIK